MKGLRPGAVVALLTLFVVVSVAGCAVSRNPLSGRKRAYAYSWQQEIQLGREADASIMAEYGLYDDPELTRYVDSLGQALLAVSHLRRPDALPEWRETAFTFRVLDSPVVNAFALPGGFVYVTRGLMAHVEDEAQLAVVIGHEIGHVAGRHASRRAATQMLGQALLIGGALGGQALFGDEVASGILNLGSQATQLLFLRYGRDDERESDDVGVEYAALAGYDAARAADFFGTLRRLGEQSGQSLPAFLSTHPDPGEREQTVARLAAEWKQTQSMETVARDRLLAHVEGIVAGQNPRQGFVRDGEFLHPDLAFRFPVPEGFTVVNQPARVVMMGPEQKAMIVFQLVPGVTTAREAAEQFSARDDLTVVQAGIGSSNGFPAQFVVAEATTEDGGVLRVRGHFVDYGERVFAFLGVTAQADYPTWEGVFTRTMQRFGPLQDPAVLSIEPTRIALVRASGEGPLSALLPADPPGGFTPAALAILNQRTLSSTVAAGERIKVVR